MNFELINQLAASTADNAIEEITLSVRVLAVRYGWEIEEMMAVGALVCEQRRKAVEATVECVRIGVTDALSGL